MLIYYFTENILEKNQHLTVLHYQDKEIILVGTAHVSPKSAEEVKKIIEEEKPNSVCIELDKERYKTLTEKKTWSETEFTQVIKDGKAGLMFANILLSNYQQKLAKQFGIRSGQEMIQGIQSAKDIGAELVLADRSIEVTFNRIWHGCTFWEKCKLIASILVSFFDREEISEADLEELKSQDMLTGALNEFGSSFSNVKKYLVSERDVYLCEKIKNAPGKKVIAIVGAAHVPGIKAHINCQNDITELEKKKPRGKAGRIVGWSLLFLLIALVALTFSVNPGSGWIQTRNWLILTMFGAGLGALLSLAHPVTFIVSCFMAPVSALSPLLATGWFAGLSEAHFRKPKVTDFEKLSEDLSSVKGIWKNKITRILLVVILTNLGCAIGNIAGGIGAVKIFLDTWL